MSGWVSVKAPFVIEIREDGQLIGTTETDRLMLASGRHVLEFVNPALGYRESRTVQVRRARSRPLSIELPQGSVNLNASPWAEVWIDGRRVGETPIGNLSVPIGPHEIVFRHPELGEKKQAVSVTTGAAGAGQRVDEVASVRKLGRDSTRSSHEQDGCREHS